MMCFAAVGTPLLDPVNADDVSFYYNHTGGPSNGLKRAIPNDWFPYNIWKAICVTVMYAFHLH